MKIIYNKSPKKVNSLAAMGNNGSPRPEEILNQKVKRRVASNVNSAYQIPV